jgi:predicted PilT family ATPase
MGTYRLNEDVERRLKEWAKGKYRDDAGRIAMGKFTFSDVISDLLQEAGY